MSLKGCVRANELISSWQHHGQVLIFETWRGSQGLQNSARDFPIFFSFPRYGSKHLILQNWTFSFVFEKKAVKNGNETEFQNPKVTRYRWAVVPNFGAFQLSVLEINSWEGIEEHSLRNIQFPVKIINTTKQLWWTFLPTSQRNFSTQILPVDRFEIEDYEETKKSFSSKVEFRPNSHVNMRKMCFVQTCEALSSQPKPVSLFFAVHERYVYTWRLSKELFTLDRPVIRIYWRKPAAIGKFENWTLYTATNLVNQIPLNFNETGVYGVKAVATGVFNNTEKNFTLDESTLRVSRGKQAASMHTSTLHTCCSQGSWLSQAREAVVGPLCGFFVHVLTVQPSSENSTTRITFNDSWSKKMSFLIKAGPPLRLF